MQSKLIPGCALLWALGLFGMFLTRGAGLGPGDLGFEVFARAWGVGGIAYVCIGGMNLFGNRGEQE